MLDEHTVQIQPLHITSFAHGLSDIGAATAEGEDEGEVDYDLLEILVTGYDGLSAG